jgi:alpha-galactosidase
MAVKLFKSVSAALELASIANALVSPDGTGRLPALGWSSWNEYACDINEAVFLKVSDRLIELGLKDLGYEYINIDDCWSNKQNQRDNTTERINVDKNKFPNGISGLAEKVHAKGLKLGIYSDAGTLTCGGYAGSLNYEDVDAATFAEWGVDCEWSNIPSILTSLLAIMA